MGKRGPAPRIARPKDLDAETGILAFANPPPPKPRSPLLPLWEEIRGHLRFAADSERFASALRRKINREVMPRIRTIRLGQRWELEVSRDPDMTIEEHLLFGLVRLLRKLNREPGRLKVCPSCGQYFWDRSRNRSRRWCSVKTCGNREAQRRLREKRKS